MILKYLTLGRIQILVSHGPDYFPYMVHHNIDRYSHLRLMGRMGPHLKAIRLRLT